MGLVMCNIVFDSCRIKMSVPHMTSGVRIIIVNILKRSGSHTKFAVYCKCFLPLCITIKFIGFINSEQIATLDVKYDKGNIFVILFASGLHALVLDSL